MRRPRLKPVFTPIELAPRTLSLGFPRTPRSAVVPDPDGRVRAVLGVLDGSRDIEDVVGDLTGRCDRDAVLGVVAALAAEGFLEDASVPPPAELSGPEVRRYSRNSEFFSYFTDRADVPAATETTGSVDAPGAPDALEPTEDPGADDRLAPLATRYSPQRSLRRSTVVVLGVGGLGSHVALHLAALGVGRLHLVDFDTVEESNLNRQVLFTETDIGSPKAAAAARRLRAVNPYVEVVASESAVRGVEDATRWLTTGDLLVCAADRPRVDLDRWLNTAALASGRPWMRGSSVGLTAVLDLFVPGRTACAECRLAPDADGSGDRHLVDAIRSLGDVAVSPCVAPVAGLLGSLAALEAMKVLTGITPSALLDHQLVVDLPNAELHHLPDPPHPTCPTCSPSSVRGGDVRARAAAHA